jgi:uncharacterized membrane protein (UPF0136 family)
MLGQIAPWSMLVMAVLMGIGGRVGYRIAKSKASLIAGTISSGLFAAACVLANAKDLHLGVIMGLVLSLMLCIVFAIRLKKTGKFMPAGMMLVICIVESIFLGVTLKSI